MKLKQNLILLIVLIVFASVILLVERPFENKAKKIREEASPLFPDLKGEQVKKFVVKKNGTTTTLKKEGGAWYIHDKEAFPADPTLVEGLIKKIQDFKKINLASRKKDKHPLFEVKEGMGVDVALFGPDEKKLARFLIGKTGPDFLSTYIRKDDADDVYLYEDYLKGDFDREVNNWRDRAIVEFNPHEVVELTIIKKKEKETIVLTKDTQNNWHLEEPISSLGETPQVEKILATLASLKAANFADEENEAKGSSIINDPEYQLSVKLKDSQKKTVFIGNKKDDGQYYYVKSDQKKYLFLIHQSTVGSLTPKVKDLEKAKTDAGEKKAPEKTEPTHPPQRGRL